MIDIRYVKLPCHVEGGQPLHLTLVGSCISQPEGEVIQFKTPVRKPLVKTIGITNTTGSHWKLTPQFDNELFTGTVKELKVAPSQTVNFDITYYPITMTMDKSEHRGTLYFALPDGQMLVYQLLGTSLPPLPVSTVTRSVPCKSQVVQQLAVKNWLKEPQRFKVTIDSDKDPSLTIKGLDYIDVPGLGERQYKLSFFSFKEGNYNVKVTFTNDKKEYMYYVITFTTSPPEVLKTIELETPVRRSIVHSLAIHNPLDVVANFNLTCDNSELSFPPTLVVQAG